MLILQIYQQLQLMIRENAETCITEHKEFDDNLAEFINQQNSQNEDCDNNIH